MNDLVLMQGYKGEPIKMRILQLLYEGSVIYTKREDINSKGLYMPRRFLFAWDEGVFQALHQAYESSDQKLLSRLWGQAARYESS